MRDVRKSKWFALKMTLRFLLRQIQLHQVHYHQIQHPQALHHLHLGLWELCSGVEPSTIQRSVRQIAPARTNIFIGRRC